MTEEERNMDPAYLRGRIDGLEAIVSSLVYMLPIPALRSLEHHLKHDLAHVITRRDADPEHVDWDMRDRSHFRPDRRPPVTLHADGFLATTEELAETLQERIFEQEQQDGYSVLAATPEAITQDAEQQTWRREHSQD